MTNYDRRLERAIEDYQAGIVTVLAVERAARDAQSAHFAYLVGRLVARLRGSAATGLEPRATIAKTA